MQREALHQLGISPGHELEGVSTIAWIGYDAPQIPGFDETLRERAQRGLVEQIGMGIFRRKRGRD